MTTSAVITMIIGVTIVWGALIASVVHAVRTHRANTRSGPPRPDL